MPKGIDMSIEYYYDSATEQQRLAGLRWYDDAHALACQYAAAYRVPLHIVAALISVLSPSVSWERNLLDAKLSLDAWQNGGTIKGPTTYKSQVVKAERLLADLPETSKVLEYIGTPRALKTRAFYHNILKPDDPEHVTVDRWMLRAHGLDGHSVGKRQYVDITKVVKDIALAERLVPCQAQAIVWQNIRSSVTDNEDDIPGF